MYSRSERVSRRSRKRPPLFRDKLRTQPTASLGALPSIELSLTSGCQGLVWPEYKCVASFDRSRPFRVSKNALARNHLVKLPLSAMRMIGPGAVAWRYTANLNIERMPLVQVSGQRLTP